MRQLMAKIGVAGDSRISTRFSHKIVIRVTAETTGGQGIELETGDPCGDSTNSMDDMEIGAKFRLLIEPLLGSAGATRVLEIGRGIDSAGDVTETLDALAQ